MDDEETQEFYGKLSERIASLEERNERLARDTRHSRGEKRLIESELVKAQREAKRLRGELDRLKAPPLIIGSIRDLLTDGRVIVKSSTGPDFIVHAAEYVDPAELVVGCRVALNKQTLAVMGVLPPSYDPVVLGAEVIERPPVTYDDIGGLEEALRDVREAVEDPLLKPDLFQKVGIEPPKGLLLVGPPGTGKTLIAKAVANRTEATFIRLVGSELVQKYIGEGARLVRELFELGQERAPAILFIDELDAIGAKRLEMATSGDREVQRTLMQLLAEMDGFEPLANVKIIAATNRPDILDAALLRPGRFDRVIDIPMPDNLARVEIFQIHARGMNIRGEVDIEGLATRTEGASGADIKAICTEAGMFAIRENRDHVLAEDFLKAREKVVGEFIEGGPEAGTMFA